MASVAGRNTWTIWNHPLLLALIAGGGGGLVLVFISNQLSPLIAVCIVLGLIAAVVSVKRPEWALVLTVFVIPIERLGRFTNDASMYTVSLMRIVGLLALTCMLIHALIYKKPFFFGRPFFLYLAYCAVAFLTVTHTNDFSGGIRACGAILGNLMFFFLIVNMVRNWRQVQVVLAIWLLSSVLVGVYTAYNWHFSNRSTAELEIGDTQNRFSTVLNDTSELQSLDKIPRASGTTSHPAVYGINMVLTLPFFAYFYRNVRTKSSLACLTVALIIVLYNILLTNTRAVLIVAFLVLGIALIKNLVRFSPGRIVGLLLVFSAMLPFVPNAIYERVLSASNYTYQRSATLRIRLEYWEAGLQIVKENWLLGIGVGNQKTVPKYIKSITAKETSVHNEYLETLMEVGVPGWLLFFSFVGSILRCTFMAANNFRGIPAFQNQYWFVISCQTAIIITLIFGVQVDVFHFPLKGWWLIACLSWVVYLQSREIKRDDLYRLSSPAQQSLIY